MDESIDPVTVTIKGGAQFDAPWVIVKGKTAREVNEILDGADMAALLVNTARIADFFQGAVNAPRR